jgi:hypothetical protein
MKGIGRVAVVDLHMMTDHTHFQGVRRNPAEDLVGVVTLMVVVDDHRDLIASVVLDLGVALVHYFLESRTRFHSSERVRIHFPESHPDLVRVVFFANQLQLQRQPIRILVTSSSHSARLAEAS